MNKKNYQRLNRATVATVLAASGAVAALPVGKVQANSPFTDVKADHYAYDAIMDLYNRDIISGYGNGKFGPNDPVTRGQAAKMLAQVLDLDLTNVKNPGFKDVKSNDMFYPYIAALANKGVINGFLDNTYRPNEPITRGQMAIILTKGFQFKTATNLSHTFQDVTSKTQERYYIQTVYNLNIAFGMNESMYAPYGKVTRGQMAAFLLRAENAKAIANPLYEVTDIQVVGGVTYAYVNGVKHTIDYKLKSIFNSTNADALEGAFIEGDITNTNRIQSLTKITFTANGTKNRVLQFDGGNTTFSGDVVITGNYLKFKDWTLTGEVAIEEENLKPVSAHREAILGGKIASVGSFSFIDWGSNTDPENSGDLGGSVGGGISSTGPADGSEDGSGLVSPPSGNEHSYSKRMAPIHHYIDFTNCNIKYLVIRANGTHISMIKTIPHLTVEGDVKAFEIYANVKTMYIDTEISTTMYGVSNIEEVYKNSYKSVNFDADATIDQMVVDNSNGWIDLGDYVYIDKVIIPPNKMPHEIFNDFINDNDSIGNIEDSNGDEVDRDPIENTIVPDLEDPTLAINNVEVDGNKAKATMQSNEDGEIYYMVLKKSDENIPSIRTILEGAGGTWAGKVTAAEGVDAIVEILELIDKTEYILYAVAVDEAGNISDKEEYEFRVADATPPVAEIVSALPMNGKNNVEITFKISEKGAAHYLVRRADDVVPTVADVKRLGKTFVVEDFTQTYSVRELGLEPFTNYVVYMIAEDESKNLSTTVVSAPFQTGEADYEAPILINSTMDQNFDVLNWNGEEGRTQIILRFNEPLDPESATNVKNYELSGTGNLTGNPYSAHLENGGRNVILTIPSMSAFVDNDTLVVTINSVLDLAGNEVKPDTKAVLEFTTDREAPEVNITSVDDTFGQVNKKDVTFEASVPGRYYYLVLPSGLPEDQKPKVRDVIFPEEYLQVQKDLGNVYYSIKGDTAGGIINAPGENIIKAIAYDPSNPDFMKHSYGYDIYLVMQNRDGKYTEQVVSHKFINDILHPQIVDSGFLSTVGDINIIESTVQSEINEKLGPIDLTAEKPVVYETINSDGSKTTITYTKATNGEITKTVTIEDTSGLVTTTPGTPFIPNKNFRYDVDSNMDYNPQTDKYFRYAIRFSEPMERATVESINHYILKGPAGEKLKVSNAKLLSDERTLILDLEVATGEEDYKEYELIHEEKLEIHMRNLKDKDGLSLGGEYDSNGLEKLPDNEAIDDKNDVTFEYEDQIRPKLKSAIAIRKNPTIVPDTSSPPNYKGNDEHKIELTFTEKVTLTSDQAMKIISETLDANFLNVTGEMDISHLVTNVDYSVDKKIIVTLQEHTDSAIVDKNRLRFEIEEGDVVDVAGNKFATNTVNINNISTAYYNYREFPLTINTANIPYNSAGSSDGSTIVYSSRDIRVITTIPYRDDEATVYYVVTPIKRDDLKPEDIVNATPTISNNFGNFKGINVNQIFEFSVDSPKTFIEGNYIYFVVLDSYGNVSNVSGKIIERNTVSPTPTP